MIWKLSAFNPMVHLKDKANSEISKLRGTRYHLVWKGKKYEVTVLDDGIFEYAGEVFNSLCSISRNITGTRWNGKLFFGAK